MKLTPIDFLPKSPRGRGIFSGVVVAFVSIVSGCTGPMADHWRDQVELTGPVHSVSNIFRASDTIPGAIRRVAVLPVTASAPNEYVDVGCETLGPILNRELGRSSRFEMVTVTPEQLRHWTGSSGWNASDRLPAGFFKGLQKATGCDAVLFVELTQYAPFPPLAIGWRLRLVDVAGPRNWWACDEVFDAGDPLVARAARRHFRDHPPGPAAIGDSRDVLVSPLRFGTYTAVALVATLPGR